MLYPGLRWFLSVLAYSLLLPSLSAHCEPARVQASDGAAGDFLGTSIAASGNRVVVGATGDNEGGTDRGTAFVFENQSGSWVQVAKLTPTSPSNFDFFGQEVASDGDVTS